MDFEEQRLENIRNAKVLLASLGLEDLRPMPQARIKRKHAQSKKRRAPPDSPASDTENHDPDGRPQKVAKVESDEGTTAGLRRSARNRGKSLNYNDDGAQSVAAARTLPRVITASAERAEMTGAPRNVSKRVHNPKTYGAIPGIPIGTWWETRQACSLDAVHAPWVAGISAGPHGAYSVALSGGYEDDVDLGEAFTFTGSGGRDLKGTKDKPKNLRTAPQSCDQTFENPYNRALQKSCETKKPVRVIRGYKLDSVFAPAEGYRYDGLYTVEKAWMERGLNPKGYLVCKFAFKRIPGQPPLQYGDEEEDNGEASASSADESVQNDHAEATGEETDAAGSDVDDEEVDAEDAKGADAA